LVTRIILRPLSALSLDEGLNSPCDKNASAALWKREPISDHYLQVWARRFFQFPVMFTNNISPFRLVRSNTWVQWKHLTPERSIDLCLQTFPKFLLLLVPKVTTRSLYRRRISNTVLQPRYWGREADSPEVCRLKSFKSRTFNVYKWPLLAKTKSVSQNFSLKINRLNQLITKLACLMQHWRKHKPKYWRRFGF
jgi:hypothetical protein